MKQGQFPAVIQLSSLNGQNGFKIDGEMLGDGSGASVSDAGDFNGDTYPDVLIAAPYHAGNTGRAYVVFGGPQVGSSGYINLSALNGSNGFRLDGESTNTYLGVRLSSSGDINGDGYSDILISGHNYASTTGRTYAVFGGPSVGGSGTIALSSLNGTNGLKIDGVSTGDASGIGMHTAGDVNSDGYTDITIGSRWAQGTGCAYVVFGGKAIGSSGGLIPLSSLNGANGFISCGEASNVQCGISEGTAGDVNGDGHTDLLIGSRYYGGSAGRSYVIFGRAGIGSSGQVSLSGLSGSNGFKIDGEVASSDSGSAVGSLGDINRDGYGDFTISAPTYNSSMGRGYVVFGGPTVGSSGLIPLTGLNGSNGFRLTYEAVGDNGSGVVAGDINGDGYSDLLTSASGHANSTGRGYVIFGGPGVGASGLIPLSDLNGINGFKLDGESVGDASVGGSVAVIGDINGDKITDFIIGAGGHNNKTGRTYVVFGDVPPVLVNNSLSISAGATITLNATYLAAYDPNHDNNTIFFSVSALNYGHFEVTSQRGVAVSNFTQPQLANSSVLFIHDGSFFAPSYNITVHSAGIAWTGPYPANVTFFLTPTVTPTYTPSATISLPMLLNNQLTLSNGETVTLSSTQLSASETGFDNSQLVLTVANVQNGYFTFLPFNTTHTMQWQQSQIQNGVVSFVHAGNNQAPSYSVTVSDGVYTTLPSLAEVTFLGAPVITQNSLNVSQSGSVILTPTALNVSNIEGISPASIIFQVTNVQHAQFLSTQTGLPVSNFTLADIEKGLIEVVQDGSSVAPTYTIQAISPGGQSSALNLVTTQFSNHQGVFAPRMVSNYLSVTQGQPVVASVVNIQAQQEGGQLVADNSIFYLSGLEHGQWELTNLPPRVGVSSFTQLQLQSGQARFVPDGSRSLPTYQVSVLDPSSGLQSASLPASIFFYPLKQPPQLINTLFDQTATVGKPFSFAIPFDTFQDPQGEAIQYVVSRFNSHIPLPDWLQFDPLNVRFTGTPAVSDFIDVNVTAIDSSGLATTTDFTITVSSAASSSDNNSLQKTIAASVVSGVIGLSFAAVQVCLKRAANQKLQLALSEEKNIYDLEVVRPVAQEIAKRLKITGFMNYTTSTEMHHFKSAVRSILSELTKLGVDLNFSDMAPAKRDSLINEIAKQTRKAVLPEKSCCSGFVSFFKAQATPEELEKAAPAIAEAVVQALTLTMRSTSKSTPALEMQELSSSSSTLFGLRSSMQIPSSNSLNGIESPQQSEGTAQVFGS